MFKTTGFFYATVEFESSVVNFFSFRNTDIIIKAVIIIVITSEQGWEMTNPVTSKNFGKIKYAGIKNNP